MKTLMVIKNILPMLSAIQQGGAFSEPVRMISKNWAEELTNAANEDLIEISDVIATINAISLAEEFESQQDEMYIAMALLDQLLEDIPAGQVKPLQPVTESIGTLKPRLNDSILKAIDVYSIAPDLMEKMRKDAAALNAAVLGAYPEDSEEKTNADIAYDLIDRSMACNFHQRRQNLLRAQNHIEKIAA